MMNENEIDLSLPDMLLADDTDILAEKKNQIGTLKEFVK